MTKRTNQAAELQLRQGDVYLRRIDKLPDGAKEVPLEGGRIVLAYGEVTGHAHAIADHTEAQVPAIGETAAAEIVEALIARCKAKLYQHGKRRYLVVDEAVNLGHEEHRVDATAFPQFRDFAGDGGKTIVPPGIYRLPVQVEHTVDKMTRRVAD
jgi:hypothetical protein